MGVNFIIKKLQSWPLGCTHPTTAITPAYKPFSQNNIYSKVAEGKLSAVSETLIFSLVDAGCLALFLFYSRCFFSCEKLLRKEEARRWLEGLKGVVMALSLLLLFALSGWKAALWSIAVVAPIGLSMRLLFGAKLFGAKKD